MSATPLDAALEYLTLAGHAIERARECVWIHANLARKRQAALREAREADHALSLALQDVVDDVARVQIARVIRRRLEEER